MTWPTDGGDAVVPRLDAFTTARPVRPPLWPTNVSGRALRTWTGASLPHSGKRQSLSKAHFCTVGFSVRSGPRPNPAPLSQ
jgi:hypothetical protein